MLLARLARPARPTHLLLIALALCAALAALAAPGRLHAEAPAGVVEAAQADLAERLGGDDPAAYAVLRAEAIVWSGLLPRRVRARHRLYATATEPTASCCG